MKSEVLRSYFNKIMEGTNGDDTSNSEIIDYKCGTSLSIDEIEEEYLKYQELEQELEDYIKDNELDDIDDADEIKEHFKYKIKQNLFMINQAVLINFTDYMIAKINKRNENFRLVNINFGKNGNGYDSFKVGLPAEWVRKLGFTEEDKRALIEVDGYKIIIQKYQ